MKRIVRFPARFVTLAAAAAIVLSFAGSGYVSAQTIAAPEKLAAAKPTKSAPKRITSGGPHVYLLRGLLNIFSLGMDDLAQKISARGIRATVHNHAEWQSLADEIAAKYTAGDRGAIVLIGHSLGADAVMFMGEYLGKKGVPVALIVPFDGTGSFSASRNVARVMNLTQRDYARMTRGSGFRGELNNIDVTHMGVGHIDIDKSARLHTMVVNKVVGVVGRGGGTRTASPDGAPRAPAARPSDPAAPSGDNPPKPAPSPAANATSGSASAVAPVTAAAPAIAAAPATAAASVTAAAPAAPVTVAAPAAPAPAAPAAVSSAARETAPAKPAAGDTAAPAKPAIRF